MWTFIFWFALAILVYTYFFYGILITVLNQLKKLFSKNKVYNKEYTNTVALIIPAYNEEKFIAHKIKNSLRLEYPESLLEIWVVTDGSTDQTNKIVQNFAHEGVRLYYSPERRGKVAAINRVMPLVQADIVVYSDANTMLNRDAIKNLVSKYQDEKVGAVAGEKVVIEEGGSSSVGNGEGLYWKYESFLKQQDSAFYSVVGAAGELFSMRTQLFQPLKEDTILDDFMLSFQVNLQGFKVAYAPEARARELPSSDLNEEKKRKVRISAGGFQVISRLPQLWNFTRFPLLSFQYISHRVLRWTLCPLAIPTVFIANVFLLTNGFLYQSLFLGQVLFYTLAATEWGLTKRKKTNKITYIPYYFLFMNISVLQGAIRFFKKRQPATWEKAQRREGVLAI